MAVSSIKAAPSAFNANSYVTVAEADQYFSDRLAATDWTGASDDDKKKALLEAIRRIDSFRYHERKYRTNPEQPLQFPRSDSNALSGSADSVAVAGSGFSIVAAEFSALEQYPDDFFNRWGMEFTSGAYKGEVVLVTDFVKSTGTFTIETPGGAPTAGDTFRLIEKIPDGIKRATYEISIWLLSGAEADGDNDPDVKEHRIGNFSETFIDGSGVEVRLPRKAIAYLRKFISHIGTIE